MDEQSSRSLRSAAQKSGLKPGTLVHVGDTRVTRPSLRLIRYNPDAFRETTPQVDAITIDDACVNWIEVSGLHNVELIGALGERFNIHPLVLEDILNTRQRTKIEEFDDFIYIVLRSSRMDADELSVSGQQLSIVLGSNFVLAFKESEEDLFAPVRERLRQSRGRARKLGADYLTYMLLDFIVDEYFHIEDILDELVEVLQEEVINSPSTETLSRIQQLKREMTLLRRSVVPLRELVAGLLRNDSELISDKTRIYLRDVSDHAIRISETLESYRELVSGLLEIYISSVSNRMNEVMKVLTVFATIFIPLTFIVGIYGMNFQYMPELHWRWAYPVLWLAMLGISGGLLYYFKRRGWF